METLIVRIKQKDKISFTHELLNSFSFLEVKEQKDFTAAEKKMVKNLSLALKEVGLSLSGKKKLKTLQEVIDEL